MPRGDATGVIGRMLRTLAVAASALVVTCCLLEVGIRAVGLDVSNLMNEARKYGSLLVWDADGGYLRHPAHTSVVLQGVTLRFNMLGMRDADPTVPKPAGRRRVLLLGDSFVLGPGVAQDQIVSARLRAALARDGLDLVVAGVAGWNTADQARFVAAQLTRLEPDLVALLYVVNDADMNPLDRARRAPRSLGARLYRLLVLRSRLAEWVAWVWQTRIAPHRGVDWNALREMKERERRRQAAGPRFARDDTGWLQSRAALERIDARVRARGGQLVVFLYNWVNGPPAPAALARLQEFGRDRGVPVFDTLPFFAEYDPNAVINTPLVDFHLNARGHALLAAGIETTLRREHLLP